MKADNPTHLSPPMPIAVKFEEKLAGFVRVVRENGFKVGIAEQIDARRTVVAAGLEDRHRVKCGLRALLCSNQEEWREFDRIFDDYWASSNRRYRRTRSIGSMGELSQQDTRAGLFHQSVWVGAEKANDAASGGAAYKETLAKRDFEFIANKKEMLELEDLAERLARRMRLKASRRLKMERQGRRVSLRGTMRGNLQHGGVLLDLVFMRRRLRQLRVVTLVDVSRSMSVYGYLFLRFARGILSAFKESEFFACHTRLVRMTAALRRKDLAQVRRMLVERSEGWSGGTRLGESVSALVRDYGRLLTSKTVMVIVSDGLDTGDPALLSKGLAAIKGKCRKTVWLNPLLGREGYSPRTGAMVAALPYIDLFAPAHNMESLKSLEAVFARL